MKIEKIKIENAIKRFGPITNSKFVALVKDFKSFEKNGRESKQFSNDFSSMFLEMRRKR